MRTRLYYSVLAFKQTRRRVVCLRATNGSSLLGSLFVYYPRHPIILSHTRAPYLYQRSVDKPLFRCLKISSDKQTNNVDRIGGLRKHLLLYSSPCTQSSNDVFRNADYYYYYCCCSRKTSATGLAHLALCGGHNCWVCGVISSVPEHHHIGPSHYPECKWGEES